MWAYTHKHDSISFKKDTALIVYKLTTQPIFAVNRLGYVYAIHQLENRLICLNSKKLTVPHYPSIIILLSLKAIRHILFKIKPGHPISDFIGRLFLYVL